MSFENPTRLRIGMHGDFAGKDFRLLGRVVMGVEINGETYYWNEFNLAANTGETATLVYEDTENGGEWRLFTMFEPDYPLTAAEAVLKQVGDELNLTGINVRVTLVQTSRVYRVEGTAPEGVRVGSEANYFNAEAGDVMQVVSWTGREVEYYNGITLSRGAVDAAFNLPRQAPAKIFSRPGGSSSWDDSGAQNYLGTGKFIFHACLILLVFYFIFGRNFSCSTSHASAPTKRIYAAPPPLMTGASGNWEGENFRITAHAVVEIAEVSTIYERHEYELTDSYGLVKLLVCGDKPGAQDWTLYAPLTPLEPPTPAQAAAQKVGDTVIVDGVGATVRDLFQSTVKSMDSVASSDWHQGEVKYGYAAGAGQNSLLVRWDNQSISFLRGEKVDAKAFTAAMTTTNSP